MLPEDQLWPIGPAWDFHAGGGAFRDIHVFTEALNARYGPSKTVEEFARKSQMMAYEGERAMFEGYGRNKFTSTGVIQWMLNNAWPSTIWHLYDWYMRPGGSYFGAKKGCEPLHVQYSYDDRSVVVVNSYMKPFAGVKVTAKVYGTDMLEKFSKQTTADIPENSSTRVFDVPEIKGLTTTYFLSLTLADASGPVSTNFYWLSTKPETLDWDQSTWYHTPTKTFADYTALNSLPQVDLTVAAESAQQGGDRVTTVTVTNPGKTLAFGVHLKVKRGPEGEEFLPVLWQDNYFPLLPGESRRFTATYAAPPVGGRRGGGGGGGAGQGRGAAGPAAVVEVEGWNVKTKSVTVP
jgi:exo-1,4-beta-D-glucosaminidase